MRAVVFALLLALLACGGGDERGPADGASQRPSTQAPPSPQSTAEQQAALRSRLVWTGSGPAGDVDADMASCQNAAAESPRPPGAQLAGVAAGLRCLKEKGWELKPSGS